MASLGLPEGFEVFHNVKDVDDLDDMSVGSVGDMSLLTLGSTLEHALEDHGDESNHETGDLGQEGNGDMEHASEADDSKPAAVNEASHPSSEPRMVSADSMATVRIANVNQPPPKPPVRTSQTPYDSLKDLVNRKKRQHSLGGTMNGNFNGGGAGAGNASGGMVSRPSTFLRQALYGQKQAPQPNQEFEQLNKKPKIDEVEVTNPLLHKACMKHGAEAEVIQAILKIDKKLATKSDQIYQTKEVFDCVTYKFRSSKVKEKYTYPLNIALCNKIKPAAIELLVRAAPQVTSLSDGSMKECALSILLKHNPQDAQLADLLLLGNPACARIRDRHMNTPLHIACQYGAALATVKHLCIIYPEALKTTNRFGYTPIEVAQRSLYSSHIANYLYGKQKGIF